MGLGRLKRNKVKAKQLAKSWKMSKKQKIGNNEAA